MAPVLQSRLVGRPTSLDPRVTEKFLKSPLVDEVSASIGGNATREVKEITVKWLALFHVRGNGFASSVADRIEVTEVSVAPKKDEPRKLEGYVVCELSVTEDMVNAYGSLHGACATFLIDECSTLPLSALDLSQGGRGDPGVSQTIDTVFHAPAPLGAKLRIVSTSLTIGARAMSTRAEIWDATNHRLVASGVQLKMQPSPPKPKL